MKRVVLLIPLLAVLLGCGTQNVVKEDEAAALVMALPPYDPGVVILEREIVLSELIIRAGLINIEAKAMSDAEGKHRPNVKFNFTILETLKGTYTGETVSGFWVGAYGYDTRDEAIAGSSQRIAERDTQWDNKEAILLLNRRQYPDLAQHALDTPSFYILAKELERAGPADDHHSLYSAYHRTWLPLANTAGQGSNEEFLLAPPAPIDALKHPNGSTITLGKMKRLITDVTAEYSQAAGSDAHIECLDQKYRHLERVRNWPITGREPHTFWKANQTMLSGQAANTSIDSTPVGVNAGSGYQVGDKLTSSPVSSFTGADADLFSIGFTPFRAYRSRNTGLQADQLLQNTRPLPAGQYELVMETRPPAYAICNFVRTDNYTITVTAPAGTLHEAFFDPVTATQAQSGAATVAADTTNGVLKPASFTDANGASATIQSIAYESPSTGSGQSGAESQSGTGTVKLMLSPHTGLANHVLDFIALDGKVSLSLDADDATVDAANNTLSWPVTYQPWKDGDKLMLRIHNGPVTPRR